LRRFNTVLVLFLVAFQIVPVGHLRAQVPGTGGHEHLTEVAGVDAAVLSYAVMRPGDNSRVHTHPGPEGWYVLAGEQCLETPDGANKARAGGTMTARSNIPMELNVTGTALRRAFAVVIHDAAQERGVPSDWKPSGACSR
jgi:quercetin dioxygenase-like cupin family protein